MKPSQFRPQAATLVPDGAVIMAGGFGMTGNPVHLLRACRAHVRNLTLISNNVGEVGLGGRLLCGQLKAIGSFYTSNPEMCRCQSGALEVQLMPRARAKHPAGGRHRRLLRRRR
jgi:3-oxoacid CoA-transferase